MRETHHASNVLWSASNEVAVAVFGHPMGASEMSGMQFASTFWLTLGIDAEQDFGDLGDGCTVRFGVKEPCIELQMLTIVISHEVILWRNIGEVFSSFSCHFCPPKVSLRNNG